MPDHEDIMFQTPLTRGELEELVTQCVRNHTFTPYARRIIPLLNPCDEAFGYVLLGTAYLVEHGVDVRSPRFRRMAEQRVRRCLLEDGCRDRDVFEALFVSAPEDELVPDVDDYSRFLSESPWESIAKSHDDEEQDKEDEDDGQDLDEDDDEDVGDDDEEDDESDGAEEEEAEDGALSADKATSGSGDGQGLIARIFAVDPGDLNTDYARGLYRRFIYQRQVLPTLEEFSHGRRPLDLPKLVQEMQDAMVEAELPIHEEVKPLADEWQKHKERLKQYRGKELIGLRTGMQRLDERTLGLRGLTLLGAMPGVGKIALATQLAIGICRHHADNDAVVVYFSLDMARDDIINRVHTNLAGIDWTTLHFGSEELRMNGKGPWFNPGHRRCLVDADKELEETQVGSRLIVHDWTTLGTNVSAHTIVSIVNDFRQQVGARRALVIVDYLQLLGVPDEAAKNELDADRYRVRLLQDIVAKTKTPENPQGDTVLAISEARKPANSKDGWGHQLSELMGSARLAYAPDAVILYRQATLNDLTTYFGVKDQEQRARKALEERGIAPIVLTLAKGRDGTRRGEWPVEFHFQESRFLDVRQGARPGPEDEEAATNGKAGRAKVTAPALPPGGRSKKPKPRAKSRVTEIAASNGKAASNGEAASDGKTARAGKAGSNGKAASAGKAAPPPKPSARRKKPGGRA